ncbi:MAG: hypothetical protein NTU61_00450, partial [Candidatus Altiarchaeota archaeon]|nr:hypothetical protein [Candidatus Altiarchaeota archaeon]
MAKTVFNLEGGELKTVDPSKIEYGGREEIPGLRGASLSSGHVPPQLMPRMMALQKETGRLAYAAYRMSRDNPDVYGVFKSMLDEGKMSRAELMLLVADRNPAEVDSAAVAVLENVDEGRLSALNSRLIRGERVDIVRELDGLLPKPEPRVVEKRSEPHVIREQPKVEEPPKPPQPSEEERLNNQVEDNILANFREHQWERASDAYERFRTGGGRLNNTDWRDIFHTVGRLHNDKYPDEKLLYFEHMLEHPKQVRLFNDNDRISRAGDLMDSALFQMSGAVSDEVRARVFSTVFLSTPEDFTLLTGERSDAITKALISASPRSRDRSMLLTQIVSDRDYMSLALDHERVKKGRTIVESICDLAAGSVVPQTGVTLEESVFDSVFIRTPGVFRVTTGDSVYESVRRMRYDADSLHELEDYRKEYMTVVSARPEMFDNTSYVFTALPQFIRAASGLPDGGSYIRGYFNAIVEDERYARELCKPEVLDRSVSMLSSRWMDYVTADLVLDPEFMSKPKDAQDRILSEMRDLVDDKGLVLRAPEANERGKSEARERQPNEKTPEARPNHRKLEETLTIHGIKVPNPKYLREVDYPGDVRGLFMVLNRTYIRQRELQAVMESTGRMPYQQQQILNALSNMSDGDFEARTEDLQELMVKHPLLGRVYRQDRRFLDADLEEMKARGLAYFPSQGSVRLSERIINVGETPALTPEAELALVGFLNRESPDYDLEKSILLSLARAPNYLADRNHIVRQCEGFPKAKVLGRIDRLDDMGLIVNPEPGKNLRMLSPNVISGIPDMVIPRLYREEYSHVIDPIRRVNGMYHPTFTDEKPAHAEFHPDIAWRRHAIEHAVELISTGGRGEHSGTSEATLDVIERRTAVLKALSNLNLGLDHGAKLEELRRNAGSAGLSEGEVQDILTSLVRAGIVDRVALGYYKIKQEYWKNIPSKQGQIGYGETPDYSVMHENVDEDKLALDLNGSLGNSQAKKALSLLKLLSHQHKSRQHCARAIDLRDLLQMRGVVASESQIRSDLAALSSGVSPTVRVSQTRGGREFTEREEGFFYPPLTGKVQESPSEVYWTIKAPMANLTTEELAANIPKGAVVFDRKLELVSHEKMASAL